MIDLVILWHMHQPRYVHPVTGRPILPWVRLHACSGYLDMARALERHPSVRVTVNFVPSLVEQIDALVAGLEDELEVLAKKPVTALDPAEKRVVRERCFSVVRSAIDARPRFAELASRARWAPFGDDDLRDLQCLFLLGWLGFAAREDEPAIAALDAKDRGYSEADKAALLGIVRRAAARVLPAWRRLAAQGTVELATSPYHHPIVPLLIDTDVAKRSRPHDLLPLPFAHPDDAREQIARAIAAHTRTFGAPPTGMWPPEGSLSPEAVALYREVGVAWLCGDEETLARSLVAPEHAGEGVLRAGGLAPAALGAQVELPRFATDLHTESARPHARVWRHDGVDLLFRDRDLSDRIGFRYAHEPADRAVSDFMDGVRASGGRDGMVGVFLDGENAWEGYAHRGRDFLEGLYSAIEEATRSGWLRSSTVSGCVASRGPGAPLHRLHSGSWIAADFRIWIGEPAKNRGWAALARARERLAEATRTRGCDDPGVARARDCILAAEASDWFWWFGEPNNSTDEPLFDELFRANLIEAWRALGDTPPGELHVPIGA